MALRPYEKLSKVTSFADTTVSSQIENNLAAFLDWGFINIGAYSNVPTGANFPYGNRDGSQLRLGYDKNYASGRVWEGLRKNWIYESGYDHTPAALTVSGVYVNGTFYNTGTTGAFSHTIDYPNGRVIFNNAISTGSVVKAPHSFKTVQFVTSDHPTWLQLQTRSLRGDDTHFDQYASGVYSVFSQTRVQLPLVVVQVTSDKYYKPFQVGDGAQKCYVRTNFHIFAENESIKRKICDIISNQNEKTIKLFDDNVMSATDYPLTVSGTLRSGARSYPALVSDFYWHRDLIFHSANSKDLVAQPGFYQAIVNMEVEVLV